METSTMGNQRLVFTLSGEASEALGELKNKLQANSKAQILRDAISLFYLIFKHVVEKEFDLCLINKKGEVYRVTIPGFPIKVQRVQKSETPQKLEKKLTLQKR
jgi:hypothetical protein